MKTILLMINFLLAVFICRAQDINFSQFYELPLLRNPALAGTYKGDYRFTTAYRNQWASVSAPYKTAALGGEARLPIGGTNNYLSLGMQITHDQAGDSRMSKTQVLPLLAFHKSLNAEKDAYLTIGFMAGGSQQRYDPTNLKFSDQFVGGAYSASNPTQQTFQNTSVTSAAAGFGLAYSSIVGEDTRFYFGGALFHFNQPRVAYGAESDIRLNKKYVFNMGVSGPVGDVGRIIFYGDYFSQGGNNQMQGGLMYQQNLVEDEQNAASFSFGGFFRLNDAIIPLVKLTYNRFTTGLTYDVNISKLKPASSMRGGFELTLSYSGFFRGENSSLSAVRCPISLH
jgi:type IX secretion system PorP/SprF family membrane protein